MAAAEGRAKTDARSAFAPNLMLRTQTAGLANHHGCPRHGALAEYVDVDDSCVGIRLLPKGTRSLAPRSARGAFPGKRAGRAGLYSEGYIAAKIAGARRDPAEHGLGSTRGFVARRYLASRSAPRKARSEAGLIGLVSMR